MLPFHFARSVRRFISNSSHHGLIWKDIGAEIDKLRSLFLIEISTYFNSTFDDQNGSKLKNAMYTRVMKIAWLLGLKCSKVLLYPGVADKLKSWASWMRINFHIRKLKDSRVISAFRIRNHIWYEKICRVQEVPHVLHLTRWSLWQEDSSFFFLFLHISIAILIARASMVLLHKLYPHVLQVASD